MDKVINITQDSFDSEVLKESKPVVVKFWAPWCGPCKALGPVIEEIAKENEATVKIVGINVDEAKDLCAKYGIRGIPAILYFKNGEVKSTHMGNQPKSEILKRIAEIE